MGGDRRDSIDELLDRAVSTPAPEAAGATTPKPADGGDPGMSAKDLPAGFDRSGEIRRLTLMFVDVVDSTALSTRVEPETYRTLVSNFRNEVRRVVSRYEGHITSSKGDGLLAVFGHPRSHEDDTSRAVSAGLDITRAVAGIGAEALRRFGVGINSRVGVHRGPVYLDIDEDDVYGFAVNLAARITALAEPGTIAVSEAVAERIAAHFELAQCAARRVKGVEEPVAHYRVVGERALGAPAGSTPLIGRDAERAQLHRAWLRACDGATVAVGLRGEAGIGKTRLTRVAADLAESAGATVLELRGSPLHVDSGLHPVRRLLERRCGITRRTDGPLRLGLLTDELCRRGLDPDAMVPLLAPVLGLGPEHGYRPAAVAGPSLYQLINGGVLQYLLACRHGGPGLIIAEDAHWYDPSTMDLVDALLGAEDNALLVVLTGRDGNWPRPARTLDLIELAPLGPTDADALIHALRPAATDDECATVRDRCDGVPFYIEHVVAGLDALADGQVPEALYDPLFARLHTRPAVVPVLEAAAVIGRSGDSSLLAAVVGHIPVDHIPAGHAPVGEAVIEDVESVVHELISARVFEPTADGWRFRHELFREVAAELAPPTRRYELHARAAGALVHAAAGAQPDWRLVAAHYDQAHRYPDAVTSYRNAADGARRRGAVSEALNCLGAALGQLDGCAADRGRDVTEITIRLERAFLTGAADGGTSGDAPSDLQRCLELASGNDYPDQLFATLVALIGYYVPRAELSRAQEVLESLSSRITANRPWCYPAIASSLGTVSWLRGDFRAARCHLRRALDDSSAANPTTLNTAWWVATDPIASAHNYLALGHTLDGDLPAAEAELAAGVRRAEALSYPQNEFNRAMAHFMQIWVYLEAGRYDAAAEQVAGLRALSERSGLDLWRFVCATEHATVRALGELRSGADAAVLAASAERIASRIDASRFLHLNVYLTFHDAVIARLLIDAGRPVAARSRLDLALRYAEESDMHFEDAELLRLRAHTVETPALRRAALGEALECARRQGAQLFQLRCLLDGFTLCGDGDRAALADAVAALPEGADLPERLAADRILS